MRPCRFIGSMRGNPTSADAALAGEARNSAPGRPWPAVRRHYDRLPTALRSTGLDVRDDDGAVATAPDRAPNTGPVVARKHGSGGLKENAARGAPGGASCPIARAGGTPSHSVPGGLASCPGGLATLRVCRRSAPLEGAKNCNCDCGGPGADQTTRAMSHACAKRACAPAWRRPPAHSSRSTNRYRH